MSKSVRRNSVIDLWIAVIALWGVAFAASTDQLTAQEKRGKQIYLSGTSSSGREITAILGAEDNDAQFAVTWRRLPLRILRWQRDSGQRGGGDSREL